jgi:hypothetical protein
MDEGTANRFAVFALGMIGARPLPDGADGSGDVVCADGTKVAEAMAQLRKSLNALKRIDEIHPNLGIHKELFGAFVRMQQDGARAKDAFAVVIALMEKHRDLLPE